LCELPLTLDESSTLEDAALQMQDQIERLPADPGEQLRLIRWRTHGRGRLMVKLSVDGGRSIDDAWRSDFAPRDDLKILAEFTAEFTEPEYHILPHDTAAARREIAAGIDAAADSLGRDWHAALEPLLAGDPQGARIRDIVASRVSAAGVRRYADAFVRRPVSASEHEDSAS
jgi:hypothetical protein